MCVIPYIPEYLGIVLVFIEQRTRAIYLKVSYSYFFFFFTRTLGSGILNPDFEIKASYLPALTLRTASPQTKRNRRSEYLYYPTSTFGAAKALNSNIMHFWSKYIYNANARLEYLQKM